MLVQLLFLGTAAATVFISPLDYPTHHVIYQNSLVAVNAAVNSKLADRIHFSSQYTYLTDGKNYACRGGADTLLPCTKSKKSASWKVVDVRRQVQFRTYGGICLTVGSHDVQTDVISLVARPCTNNNNNQIFIVQRAPRTLTKRHKKTKRGLGILGKHSKSITK